MPTFSWRIRFAMSKQLASSETRATTVSILSLTSMTEPPLVKTAIRVPRTPARAARQLLGQRAHLGYLDDRIVHPHGVP